MDDELSARAKRLVEVAMAQDVPPEGVADDSWGMVVSRVSVDTERSADALPHAVTDPGTRRGWLRAGLNAAIIVTLVAAAWLALRPDPITPASVAAPPRVPATMPTPPAKAAPPTPTADASTLLDEADAALSTAPTRALELVDRHATVAPAIDAERRMALRIAVLCALGRDDEAKAETAALFARPRADEWATRVRASCGAKGGE
jgi:hypothetical protein